VELSGGRVEGAPPSLEPSGDAERCVGRIVVGPSGEAARVGAGLTIGARLRTTLAAGASATGAGAGAAGSLGTVTASLGVGATSTDRADRVVLARGCSSATEAAGALAGADDALVALAALVGSSGCTTRRSPSASARRRMRSACASSMDAEGLDAPMPNFCASPSNSLLVRPSSFESSCTRIFFSAKTFP